jgi:hypothetical protein
MGISLPAGVLFSAIGKLMEKSLQMSKKPGKIDKEIHWAPPGGGSNYERTSICTVF